MPQSQKQGFETKSGLFIPVQNQAHIEFIESVYEAAFLSAVRDAEIAHEQNTHHKAKVQQAIQAEDRLHNLEQATYQATKEERATIAEIGEEAFKNGIYKTALELIEHREEFEEQLESLRHNYDLETVRERMELEYNKQAHDNARAHAMQEEQRYHVSEDVMSKVDKYFAEPSMRELEDDGLSPAH